MTWYYCTAVYGQRSQVQLMTWYYCTSLLAAEPSPAYDLILLHCSLLAAEPSPAYDLILLHRSLLAVEPSPAYDLILLHRSLVAAELHPRKTRIGLWHSPLHGLMEISWMLKTIPTIVTEHPKLSDSSSLSSLSVLLSLWVLYKRSTFSI